jgi:alpha-D-ribose 1-methylphosphonate 5-triphosphate diphosphatase PhnM
MPNATEAEVLSLVYELIDAHADTIEIGVEPADGLRWQAHLAYLRALQRRTREIMAGWCAGAGGIDRP